MLATLGLKLKRLYTRLFPPPAPQAADLILGPERRDALDTAYRPLRTFSKDGLALAGRSYGADTARAPLLCLPGLSRNVRDFEPLARRFAEDRRVIVLDLRGRGASEYDPDPRRYTPLTEAEDTMLIMDRLGLPKPILVGTSRGGLIAMTIAALRPDPFAGVVLNDIGPVIELKGLLKIKSYVGKVPPPQDWDAATDWVAKLTAESFPDLDRAAHERMARRLFRDVGGRPVADYDPNLARGQDFLTEATVLPQAWPQFAALTGCPVLVVRGSNSDILSAATVDGMAAMHPRLHVLNVEGEGHAPLLEDRATLSALADFFNECG